LDSPGEHNLEVQHLQRVDRQLRILLYVCDDLGFQCYQSLYYYSYINMHLFVESDHSFKDIYFPNPFLPHRALQVSSEASTDSEEDNDSLDLNWVENILTGE
jgi:hypothetical protein